MIDIVVEYLNCAPWWEIALYCFVWFCIVCLFADNFFNKDWENATNGD